MSSSLTTSDEDNARILIQRRTTITIVIVVMSASRLPLVVGRARGGVVSVPPSSMPPPPCDCVRTGVDAGANPVTLALGVLLPWRRVDAIQPISPPLFALPSLVVAPLVLWCGCLFCPPRQQAIQQPAGPSRTPPPPPPTAVNLMSLRFDACAFLFFADCCLPPPPVIGAGCRKGLGVKMVALLMTPWW